MKIIRIGAAGLFLTLSGSIHGQLSGNNRSLTFEENRGQAASDARFLARGQGYNLVLTSSGNQLILRHAGNGMSLQTTLVGANPLVAIQGELQQTGKVNYLRGGSALSNIPT